MDTISSLDEIKTSLHHKNTQVIAVSKGHNIDKITPLIQAGHYIYGENKIQEAKQKWLPLKQQYPQIELHLIGKLQSNKVKDAVALFDYIQSLDSIKLANVIKKECDKQQRQPKLFIQVNIGNEEQKGGVAIEYIGELLEHCKSIGLDVEGLMCVPPADKTPALYFALLQKLGKKYGVDKTSMGMSSDYEIAAHMGADYIRIGTAIFGKRDI